MTGASSSRLHGNSRYVTSFPWLVSHYFRFINLTENISLKVQLLCYNKISTRCSHLITCLYVSWHIKEPRRHMPFFHLHFSTLSFWPPLGVSNGFAGSAKNNIYFGYYEYILLLPLNIIIIIRYHVYWILDIVARISTASVVLVPIIINLREEYRDVLRWK